MKRTTIVLTDELAALLERERRRRDVSAATIVRDALDAYFGGQPKTLAITAIGRSGRRTTAQDVEAILAQEWTYEHLMGKADAITPTGPGEETPLAEGTAAPTSRPDAPTNGGKQSGGDSRRTVQSRRRGPDATDTKRTGQPTSERRGVA